MRGAVAKMSYEECFGWIKRAAAVVEARGEAVTDDSIRAGLAAVDAPFRSTKPVTCAYGKRWSEIALELHGERSAAATVAIGPNATANAISRRDPAELVRIAIERHERHKAETMAEQFRTVTITVDHPDEPIMFVGLGDIHAGSVATDPRALTERAKLAERQDIKVFFGSVGDVLDAPIKAKLIEEAWKTAIGPEEEIAVAAYLLDGFARPGKLLVVGAGNHDLFSQKLTGYSHLDVAMSRLCREVPYAHFVMFLTIIVRTKDGKHEQKYVHEIRHKYRGGGVDPSGPAIRHIQTSAEDIDVCWAGHTHRSGARTIKLLGRHRIGIQLGAFKIGMLNGYDQEHGYSDENLDPDRGVMMWANTHRTEETRTDAGVERLERFAMGVVAKTPAVARRAQRCGSAKGGRHVHRIRSAAKPPVRAGRRVGKRRAR